MLESSSRLRLTALVMAGALGVLAACASVAAQSTSSEPLATPSEPAASRGEPPTPNAPGAVPSGAEFTAAEPPTSGSSAERAGSATPSPASPAASGSAASGAGAAAAVESAHELLPRGTTVLHIGDSFAGALGTDLNKELAAHGVRGILRQEKATYIPTWASRKELSTYLSQYRPDLILVTLGGNELGIVNPEQRAETIARLVKRFGNTPCVWIGIPLWPGANPTLLNVIAQHSAPCQYLDSNQVVPDLERAKDGIHPSLAARKRWAQAVVQWLSEQRLPGAEQPWRWKRERN